MHREFGINFSPHTELIHHALCSASCMRTSHWVWELRAVSAPHRDMRLKTHMSSFNVGDCARGHKPQHMPPKPGHLLLVESGCNYPMRISIAIRHPDKESVLCSCHGDLSQRSDYTKWKPWVRNFALPQHPSSSALWSYSRYWCVLSYWTKMMVPCSHVPL